MLNFTRRFLKDYLPGNGSWYSWGLLCLLATVACQTAIPGRLQTAIDLLESSGADGLSPSGRIALTQLAALVIALGIALALFRSLSRILIFVPGRRIEERLRQDYFQALVTLPPGGLLTHKTGDLISRGTGDVTGVRVTLSMGVLHSVNGVLTLGTCLTFMLHINPALTGLCLLPAPLLQLGVRWISLRMMQRFREAAKERGRLSEGVREILGAHMLMTIYDVFDPLFQRFQERNRAFQMIEESLLRYRVALNSTVSSLSTVAQYLLLVAGGFWILKIDDGFSLGSFVAFSAYLGLIQEPLRSGGWLLSMFQRGETSLERLYEIFDEAAVAESEQAVRPIRAPEQLRAASDSAGVRLEVRGLHFAYPDSDPTKAGSWDLSVDALHLVPGQAYGIFGGVGSGKSTLVNLIAGVIPAPPGVLFINGIDYAKIHHEALQHHFSIAPQESRHFAATIRENIDQVLHNEAWASDDADQRFESAYRISRLAADIDGFPEGLDALLGEHGINLSGGQKQRLSVLRAWSKPHDVLVLDDIVSSLDHHTESELLAELFSARRANQTLLVVSHRISALHQCEQILVLDRGRIVDQGTHEELLERNRDYQRTWEHQVLEEAVSA